jgi:integrase
MAAARQWEKRLADERAARPGRNVNAFKIWRDPKMRPSRVMVWTGDQTGEFLDRAEDHRLYALYHLVAHTGVRRGEACGAEADSLDLDGGELLISANLVQLGWEVQDGDPKTEASDAPVALDKETVQVLRTHLKRRNEERLEWGDAWVESHPAYVTDQFERLAFEAGLPPITLHGLRHVRATLALAAGVDRKVVSVMLRHSSVQITQDLYRGCL